MTKDEEWKESNYFFAIGSISLFIMAAIANKWGVAVLGVFLMCTIGYLASVESKNKGSNNG